MLYTRLFRRSLAVHLTGTSIRGLSTTSPFAAAMATSPQTFTLDRTIFNETLYSSLRDFWFRDVPEGTLAPTMEIAGRWFGLGSQEEKEAFDKECHSNFGQALKALSPEHLALPAFESYEKDVEQAEQLSSPLFREVQEAQSQDPRTGSQTLLSLILLLDQMTRNIYRDPTGLRLVFSHYDRLAFSLARSSMKLSPNPVEHESVRLKPVVQSWFLMPLMHSEHMPSHDMYLDIVRRWKKEGEEAKLGEDAIAYMDRNLEFEVKHQEPLKRFGRYPHRNAAWGRKSSKEEEEFLEVGETFGVKQQEKKGKEFEKSEL